MIVGKRVRWKDINEETGKPENDLEGIVVACERGGTPSTWSLLVMRADGELSVAPATDMIVVADKPGKPEKPAPTIKPGAGVGVNT